MNDFVVNLFLLVLNCAFNKGFSQKCETDNSFCYFNGDKTIWWEIEGKHGPDHHNAKEQLPDDKIQNALKKLDADGNMFGNVVKGRNHSAVSIGSRMAQFSDSCKQKELCKLQHDFYARPKWMGEEKNKMAIVHTEKHEIVLHIKVCRSDNDQYDSLCVENGRNNKPVTVCRQLKSSIGVLVYDESGNQLHRTDIEYPSACICAQLETTPYKEE